MQQQHLQVTKIEKASLYIKGAFVTLIVAISIYFGFALTVGFDSLASSFSKIRPLDYVILLSLSFASYAIRSYRWIFFLKQKSSQIPISKSVFIYFSGFALSTTPGKIGETLRGLFLLPFGVRLHTSVALFISERSLDLLSVSIFSLVYILWDSDFYTSVLMAFFLFLSIVFVFKSNLGTNALKFIFWKKLYQHAEFVYYEVSFFLSYRNMQKIIPLSLLPWLIQGLSLYFIVSAFGFELDLFLLVGLYCASILAGAISFIPAGIGATEATMVFLLSSQGLDTASAVAVSLISRFVTLWFAIFIGIISMIKVVRDY